LIFKVNAFGEWMNSFEGVDYYNIETLLSEEEIMIRNTVREFVSNEIIPIIEKHNREATFPIHLIPKIGELGLLGSAIPDEYGGLGEGFNTNTALAMELGAGGVLLNTAVAQAKNSAQMAQAMRLSVEAGRLGYLAGRMDKKYYASASSPFDSISKISKIV